MRGRSALAQRAQAAGAIDFRFRDFTLSLGKCYTYSDPLDPDSHTFATLR